MILDITDEQAKQLEEFILTLLGDETIDVTLTLKEIKVLARKALRDSTGAALTPP